MYSDNFHISILSVNVVGVKTSGSVERMKWYQYLVVLVICYYTNGEQTVNNPVWTWECHKNRCQKSRVKPGAEDVGISLAACQISCDPYGTLWPYPTGVVQLGGELIPIDSNSIEINEERSSASALIRAGYGHFEFRVKNIGSSVAQNANGSPLVVTLNIKDPSQTQLKLNTNESYVLQITQTEDGTINATISAPTYFGGRHGLETLGQLIIYDDIRETLRIPNNVYITDEPVFSYRGILLDTARNYISIDVIKHTIDGISASKLNTFHWHITDSQSFPYVSESNPNLSRLGAYSPRQVYTPEDVAGIIEYARERGVRVLPEFDAPAHVGEGWQDTNFIACFNYQPWSNYCVEPPCGQFDPTQPELYNVLEGIYKDMVKQFNPDIFHMGGDEVSLKCWNSSEHIQNWMKNRGWSLDEAGYMKLWNFFQTQALERFDRQAGEKLPIIMWTSTLTKKEYVEQYLPKDRYIIQIWTDGNDPQISDLLSKGYKVILSNYDALYLDCGFASWVGEGTNWCPPYKGWQTIYENSLNIHGKKDQFLGAEAALWTEQVDDSSVDTRIWPRAAAMAERLWSNPKSSWRNAEDRMLIHRNRLVNRGIAAEALQPQWCEQNENNCPQHRLDGIVNNPVWTWECNKNSCQKSRVKPGAEDVAISLAACQISCGPYGTVWPYPTGVVQLGGELVPIDSNSMKINEERSSACALIKAAYGHFELRVKNMGSSVAQNANGSLLVVTLNIKNPSQTRLKLNSNESYVLQITQTEDGTINAIISAPTYFGGRHGLETLEQLIIYDDIRETLRIPNNVYITDEPVFSYRGILLDTARNYISVEVIKRTIDGISASKLNTFHWHITDSQSFPYVSESNPNMSRLGAYSPRQVYTPEDVAGIIEYARERGVRVLPEFDAPAHVGEGWQDTNFIACFGNQPWSNYCYEPPCGQLDPTQPELYNVLEGIYKDMVKQFNPDIFHMGGDEVSLRCWNSSEHIKNWMKNRSWSLDEGGYMKLWNFFQTQALERFDRQAGEKLPIILWSNTLTKKEYVEQYLPKDRYIIQVWTAGNDPQISDLLSQGYKVILSNYDALYLDCGFANWVGEGTNWCPPYKGWQTIYDNSLSIHGKIDQFLGAEAALWTEQVDDSSVDARIWPRAAALAERLWSNPKTSWRNAEDRIHIHRNRLVNRGIAAEALRPQWCNQNEQICPLDPLDAMFF
ncbi:hypothetical protein RN001_000450 [Aquatica leii]|uniref:beta-N-acetylhexosaminidase n=1 Tax=Aquatica leii TaxID=1421715 RepID=A0AAN7Q2Z8_9COLE|nr:hypothetical protein RN001_000450 [Aquatica leii]